MSDLEVKIKETAKKLLSEGTVDLIIGYANSNIPLRSTPMFFSNEQQLDTLVFNYTCDLNLAKYLREHTDKKVGIISKGCVGRAVTHLIVENQLNKDNITVIGIPCQGVINRSQVLREVGDKEIIEAKIENDKILLKGKDWDKTLALKDYINKLCITCHHKNPPVADIMVGDKIEGLKEDDFKDVTDFESKTQAEKIEYFKQELNRCIRCYACREACPVCYCSLCFVDQNKPVWFGKTTDISDNYIFHMIRGLHVAGRCVSCGACSSVCPMGIDLNLITRKVEKIVKDRYEFESGISLETQPPMGAHKFEDQQEFMIDEE